MSGALMKLSRVYGQAHTDVFLNPLHVVAVYPALVGAAKEAGSEVVTTPGAVYQVTESPDAVQAELRKSLNLLNGMD